MPKLISIFGLLCVGAVAFPASRCPALTKEQTAQIENFLDQWYRLPPYRSLNLIHNSEIDVECYQKLVFRSSVPAPLLVLYLTPDGKHLVSGVMDLTVDPSATKRKMRQELNARLVSGAILISPRNAAPVKVVVFSDFECPYCKRFAEIFDGLTAEERSQVQLISRQFPLDTHPWAREAASLTECVALQKPAAFWRLHDFIFAHQSALSRDNFRSTALDFLGRQTTADPRAVVACLQERRFKGPLHDDEQLATDLGIRGTPTVFVNGRMTIVRSVEDLRAALRATAIQTDIGKTHTSRTSQSTSAISPAAGTTNSAN